MVAKIIGLIFGGIGAVALLIVLFFTIGNLTFISQASTATGTVTGLKQGGKGTLHPVINFRTSDGRNIQFTDQVGTNPPDLQIGQQVRVYYNSDNPLNSAKPDSFLSFWFTPLLAGLFAFIFGVLGLAFYSVYYFRQRTINSLKRNGEQVTGLVVSIRLNTHVRNLGKSPHVITVRWINPQTNRTHTFISDNIWLDPLPFSPGSQICVLIDSKKPGRYYVDPLSLPSPVSTS